MAHNLLANILDPSAGDAGLLSVEKALKGLGNTECIDRTLVEMSRMRQETDADEMEDPSDPDVIQRKEEEKFYAELAEGNYMFNARGGNGNRAAGRFDRWRTRPENKEENDKYKAIPAHRHDLKAKFRQHWAKARHQAFIEEPSKFEKEVIEEFKGSTYRSFNRVVVEEGGGAAGLRNALNYCCRCLVAGKPFYKYCSWTRSVRFLYVEEGWKESFMRVWQTKKSFKAKALSDDSKGMEIVGQKRAAPTDGDSVGKVPRVEEL